MTVWVASITLRRSSASATTPLSIEKTMIGTTWTAPTSPSAIALRPGAARSDTCQRMAAVCIREPEKERSWPIQRSAKSRCRRAGNDAAVNEFLEAATDGRGDRAERILALHPKIAAANLHTALVLGDADAVQARLERDPSLATKTGGPRDWQPIHYVCYTALAHDSPTRAEGLAAIARRLIALGIDPNTRFPWLHHNVYRPVLWGASRVARSLPLVQALLDAGA